MYIQYHILGRHVILMLCLNLMLGPTYLPYFFWQQTGTTHIFHLGLIKCAQNRRCTSSMYEQSLCKV